MLKVKTLHNLDADNTFLLKIEDNSFYEEFFDNSPLELKYNAWVKRAFDLCISTGLILFICPILIPLIALLIKCDTKGSVFFIQKRNRRNGKIFNCIKFRTMVSNQEADSVPCFDNDCRITRTGMFLRKYHLDEIPQLFNVWLGQMSLIGPRPLMLSENKNYETKFDHYHYRYKVKPGITGLAQSLGHFGYTANEERIAQRLQFDYKYISKWSFKMDIIIAGRTLKNVLYQNTLKSPK